MNYLNLEKRLKRVFDLFLLKKTGVLWVFVLIFIGSLIIQISSPNLLGHDDSYFYIKIAELTKGHGGLYHEFPWLYYTTYNHHFKGLHFLSTLLFIPFTYLGNLIIGAKVATAFFFALVMALFYFILKKVNIRHTWFWVLFLLASSYSFIFRMHLSRPLSISLFFLLLGFYALIKKKYWLLFIVSFFYVWAYDGYLIILFFSILYCLVWFLTNRKIHIKSFLVCLSGVLWGTIINPYFPTNLIREHSLGANPLFTFLIVPQSAEWVPPEILGTFLSDHLVIISFALFFVGYLFWRSSTYEKEKAQEKFLINFFFIIVVFLFFMTSRSVRFFEYWSPFLFIGVAYFYQMVFYKKYIGFLSRGVDDLVKSCIVRFRSFFRKIVVILKKLTNPKNIRIVILCFIVILTYFLIHNILLLRNHLNETPSHLRYQGATDWLKKNTPKQSIVFNAAWDNFPQLFFMNTHNYYVVGLDMLFMYQYNPQLYWLDRDIGDYGLVCNSKENCAKNQFCALDIDNAIAKTISETFNSHYIFIDQLFYNKKNRHQELYNILSASGLFEKSFQDDNYPEVTIFKVK